MLEYRGYGLSQGSPSEEGLYMDARAGLDYLSTRTDINHDEIIIFGRSLGNFNKFSIFYQAKTPRDAQPNNNFFCLH